MSQSEGFLNAKISSNMSSENVKLRIYSKDQQHNGIKIARQSLDTFMQHLSKESYKMLENND